jgi:hypothetical protein
MDELLAQPVSLPDAALIAAALGDFSPVDMPIRSASASAPSDGDVYSPWAATDHFRLGGR